MSNRNDGPTKKCADCRPHEDSPASLVAARLRRSGHAFLWGIRCEFDEGVLSLIGNVPTFHLKQIAQTLAMHTPGVVQVNNYLCVNRSATHSHDGMTFNPSADRAYRTSAERRTRFSS